MDFLQASRPDMCVRVRVRVRACACVCAGSTCRATIVHGGRGWQQWDGARLGLCLNMAAQSPVTGEPSLQEAPAAPV
jgi:hypothetical protein